MEHKNPAPNTPFSTRHYHCRCCDKSHPREHGAGGGGAIHHRQTQHLPTPPPFHALPHFPQRRSFQEAAQQAKERNHHHPKYSTRLLRSDTQHDTASPASSLKNSARSSPHAVSIPHAASVPGWSAVPTLPTVSILPTVPSVYLAPSMPGVINSRTHRRRLGGEGPARRDG